jgi:DNA adenine methylase
MSKSFIRYPGGKSKFRNIILSRIPRNIEYREPFFGGGSIGLEIIEKNSNAWINDKDIGIYALWESVANHVDELIRLVMDFVPTVDAFYDFKEYFLDLNEVPTDIAECGFKKLALHQISYSGLGVKSGGPLGGKKDNEKAKYPINCRWSPEHICKKILEIHLNIKKIRITNLNFPDMFIEDVPAFLYLDPPYYVKGTELYHHSFSDSEHIQLAKLLQHTNHEWVLSYDDCLEIRKLYEWANIEVLSANYTINTSTSKTELLITNISSNIFQFSKKTHDRTIV